MDSASLPDSYLVVATLTYVSAFLITTIFHEFGHAIVAWLLGDTPTQYHVYVRHASMPQSLRVIVAASGPLFSLLQGIVCLLLLNSLGGLNGPAKLFLLWLATHGCANFFGYLITTPFVPDADLGIISRHLHWPPLLQWALVALGLTAMVWLGDLTRVQLLMAAPHSTIGVDSGVLDDLVFRYGVIPWLVGSVVIVIVSIPSPHWITFVYPPLAGLFVLLAWQGESAPIGMPLSRWPDDVLTLWLTVTLGILLLFRLLRRGFRFG